MPTSAVELDDLRRLVAGPPPFTSLYVGVEDATANGGVDLMRRLARIHDQLAAYGHTGPQIDEILRHVASPSSDDVTVGVVVAADGRAVVAASPDPIAGDVVDIGQLPRLGPMLEWHQMNVAHVVLVGDAQGFDVVSFARTGDASIRVVDEPDDVDAMIESLTRTIEPAHPHLVFVVSDRIDTQRVIEGLRLGLDGVVIERLDPAATDELADEVVRRCAGFVAERQVAFLRRFRADLEVGLAAEGIADVTRAVNDDRVSALLVNVDPDDRRPGAIDPSGKVVVVRPDVAAAPARLVDALIARTLAGGGLPVVIPSTADRTGPRDDIGALLRS